MKLWNLVKVNISRIAVRGVVVFFKILTPLSPQKHWVISERGIDARDNGLHFYRYMKREHPEQKVYYIITKDSADYERVKDDAIEYKSLRTLWLAMTAQKFISAHIFPTSMPYRGGRILNQTLRKKFYFLQHGIIKNDHPPLHADHISMNLFVCGAMPEYRFISSTFGFEEGVVRYTGLARYDALADYQTKRQILLMPTWREYLTSEDAFLQSDYYREYQKLLIDDKLAEYLERENIQLIFYPHFELQKYLKHFETKSKNVVLASFENYDVQQLLKESMLLVTDYSSVFFDFGYMEKPILHFQFDREAFEKGHYAKGYFDYDTMGFGKVCFAVEELREEIMQVAENQFVLADEYRKRIDGFFVMRDRNNCERIYQAISEQV